MTSHRDRRYCAPRAARDDTHVSTIPSVFQLAPATHGQRSTDRLPLRGACCRVARWVRPDAKVDADVRVPRARESMRLIRHRIAGECQTAHCSIAKPPPRDRCDPAAALTAGRGSAAPGPGCSGSRESPIPCSRTGRGSAMADLQPSLSLATAGARRDHPRPYSPHGNDEGPR